MDSAPAYFAVPSFPRGPWEREDTITLPATPLAVSLARRHLRETLWEWKLDFLADDAELVLSELASNAVRAAAEGNPEAGTILVRLLGGRSRLLIQVWDPALGPPVVADTGPDVDDENGRGLALVSAFATRWHWYHSPRPHGGKVVWALLEGQGVDTCTCGFRADEPDGLFDHLEEAFAATSDRDAHGVRHAEAAHDVVGATLTYQCLCGHSSGDAVGLDAHLLAVFTPLDGVGRDGRAHAPVGHDRA
ncbi:MAG TPA: ATP-binding protein [Trebonia sp.]|nr:ATP-binding protein [Trebonia sp.]